MASGFCLTVESQDLRLEIGPDGRFRQFTDRASGVNHLDPAGDNACCRVFQAGRECALKEVRALESATGLEACFDQGAIRVRLVLAARPQWIEMRVDGVEGTGIDRVEFAEIALVLKGRPDEPFAASALALNLRTEVPAWPGQTNRFKAVCHARLGFADAALAIIGCATPVLRSVLQDAVCASPGLPVNPYGGPWALDAPANCGSFLLNVGGIRAETVEAWIALAQSFGFTCIDFHGGRHNFSWGDLVPDPECFPRGLADLRAVVDRLHAAGLSAGLHTYSCFISRTGPSVTPTPDADLDSDAVFTLARPIDACSTEVPVGESLGQLADAPRPSPRGDRSAVIRIDDELIAYAGIRHGPSSAFTACLRGACGTLPSAHAASSRVHLLKQCWGGLFMPAGDSALFDAIARRHAHLVNTCGFDMVYFDALDGQDRFAGAALGWHYGAKFVLETCRHFRKPVVVEMATFHHHLWRVRSRMESWDAPVRGYKRFVDRHVASLMRDNPPALMPCMLGWWVIKFWDGANTEPTYPDDIEYLCCKALAIDAAHGVTNVEPGGLAREPGLPRLAAIFRQYETLRLGNQVPAAVRKRLGTPGQEFSLLTDAGGAPAFQPVRRHRHTVGGRMPETHAWRVDNADGPQPLRFRLEALLSAAPYDDPNSLVLCDLGRPGGQDAIETAPGVALTVEDAGARAPDGSPAVRVRAANHGCARDRAWGVVRRTFDEPLDLLAAAEQPSPCKSVGLGLWIKGDGLGETLNVRLRNRAGVSRAICDHYVLVDFTGWRYVELVEQESERYFDYAWPDEVPPCYLAEHARKAFYEIYRESVDFFRVASAGLWFHHVPEGAEVSCCVTPIRALGLRSHGFRSPALAVNGQTMTFPVVVDSGESLEFDGRTATHFGRTGGCLAEVAPAGNIPRLAAGRNAFSLSWEPASDAAARGRISLVMHSPERLVCLPTPANFPVQEGGFQPARDTQAERKQPSGAGKGAECR